MRKRVAIGVIAGLAICALGVRTAPAEETIETHIKTESQHYKVETVPPPPAVIEKRTTVETVPAPVIEKRTTVETMPRVVERRTVETVPAPPVVEERTTVKTIPAAPAIIEHRSETVETDD
jgi:hypothetical protein